MANKIVALAAGIALSIGIVGVASAKPMKLSSAQMDKVTAGFASATALSSADAFGFNFATTFTNTATAASNFFFSNAASRSASSSTAQ